MIGNLVAVNSKGPIYETFFEQVKYKKYNYILYQSTKFVTYYRTVSPTLKASFCKTVTFHIPNICDLLHQLILEIKLPDLTGPRKEAERIAEAENLTIIGPDYSWINNLGSHILDFVELQINGVTIVKYTEDYTMIRTEEKNKQYQYLESMMFQQPTGFTNYGLEENVVYVPLYFWFCEKICESLPLFLLENAKIEVKVKLKCLNDLISSTEIVDNRNTEMQFVESKIDNQCQKTEGSMIKFSGGRFYGQDLTNVSLDSVYGHLGNQETVYSKYIDGVSNGSENEYKIRDMQLICQCIDIGNEEKTKINQKEYTVVISQFQTNIYKDISTRDKYKVTLPISNPISDLYWFYRDDSTITDFNNYTNLSSKILDTNNFTVYPESSSPDQYLHQNLPTYFNQNAEFIKSAKIEIHNLDRQDSKPEVYTNIVPIDKKIQPSTFLRYIYWWRFGKEGTKINALNMDKLDRISLESIFNCRNGTVTVHTLAKSLNILKISGGMVGLLFDSP
jgi:hypothetical protein